MQLNISLRLSVTPMSDRFIYSNSPTHLAKGQKYNNKRKLPYFHYHFLFCVTHWVENMLTDSQSNRYMLAASRSRHIFTR